MKIFDSLSQKELKISYDKKIGIYVCGITPYDTTHLGHAFTFIIYDVLVRYLKFMGAKVSYVQNVTDIDDDILIKAKRLKISWKKLGQNQTAKHSKNMDALNLLRPTYLLKATDNIIPMIQIIGILVKKGLAYVKNNNVYFDIKKDKNFGKLSKYSYRAMLDVANERGNFPLDTNKKDPLDFVLWQKSKKGEPSWLSPWGKGRPGWHVECSAMSLKYLGPTITIHGGGEDLIFPHHEAEIAQSENYTKLKFVDIWMHTAMVYCGIKKMSKSLGNMIFVDDLLKKYDANTIRILLLNNFWRKPWDFKPKELENSQKIVSILTEGSKKSNTSAKYVKKKIPAFFNAIENNFNLPEAIKVLADFAKKKENPQLVYTLATQILGLRI